MTKLDATRLYTPADMLAAGWVLMEYDLMSKSFIGRNEAGDRYEMPEAAFISAELNRDWVTWSGKLYYRCKPEKLKEVHAVILPLRNVADNRK